MNEDEDVDAALDQLFAEGVPCEVCKQEPGRFIPDLGFVCPGCAHRIVHGR